MRYLILIALLSSFALADSLYPDQYNVVWTTPSVDSSGAMPLGNGDISLNVWVEKGGDLLFFIGKTDAWSENVRLLKLGRVRVKLAPNPFAAGAPFRQELRLRQGEIAITAGKPGEEVGDNWGQTAIPLLQHSHREPLSPFFLQLISGNIELSQDVRRRLFE